MFLLGLMALPRDRLFCCGLIHSGGAVGAESAAAGMGHRDRLYGHRDRACRTRQPHLFTWPLVTELYVISSRATTKPEQKRQAHNTVPVTEQHHLS